MSDFQRKSAMENCKQSGLKKRYKDTLKASLKDFDIPIGSWEQTAQERSTKEQLSMKKKKGENLHKESTENARSIPMGHQLSP